MKFSRTGRGTRSCLRENGSCANLYTDTHGRVPQAHGCVPPSGQQNSVFHIFTKTPISTPIFDPIRTKTIQTLKQQTPNQTYMIHNLFQIINYQLIHQNHLISSKLTQNPFLWKVPKSLISSHQTQQQQHIIIPKHVSKLMNPKSCNFIIKSSSYSHLS